MTSAHCIICTFFYSWLLLICMVLNVADNCTYRIMSVKIKVFQYVNGNCFLIVCCISKQYSVNFIINKTDQLVS